MRLPVSPGAVRGLLRELGASATDTRPLALGGAQELARVLERELTRDGDASAVRLGDPAGAALYLHVVADARSDEEGLARAGRARVPAVAVVAGPLEGERAFPHVRATDVVRVAAGEGFPLAAIARTVARRLGEDAAPLAARLPALRDAVSERLVASFARRNGVVAAAVFVPGADLPVLTLNQARMVLRIAQAHGAEVGHDRLPELLAVFGAGIGLRAAARELLDLVPAAGWAVKGGVAYAGTRTLGEAAVRWFESDARRPRASASPAAP